VRSSAESRTVRHEVVGLIAERFGSAGHLELVLDEVLTNAVYHAPARLDGRPKHERYAEVRLEEQEVVEVECGSDSEKYGVAVTDHSGRLTRETVLQRIERHVSGQGTLDEHGRGIHLSRVFSDRMIINIKPGARTEVILMNYFAPKYRGFKPLYINEL
jgi:anti-sigma regulatory factor (Ser/Thr protein kinase)